ncbi:MAG TPA: PrsW family glutamic-type intramembrane protease [Tepidisphaeraceae bacterium]|jgi:RsiW-degrading membrane proteinase PrsW (M82 family)|nr:PrsW family glutamic-type intramembrane protease [Tepidisphaeraceae bacterium]
MVIVVECQCGRKLRAGEQLAGRWVKCPQCGQGVFVTPAEAVIAPGPVVSAPIVSAPVPPMNAAPVPKTTFTAMPSAFQGPDYASGERRVKAAVSPSDRILSAEKSWQGYVFWLLLLALVPLGVETFAGHESAGERFERTLENHPELQQRIHPDQRVTMRVLHRILDELPDHRLDGAMVGYDSMIHWPIAMAAAGVFFLIIFFSIPGFPAKPLPLLISGIFTGTGGVMLLLGIQIFGFTCFCCLGAAYLAALDPGSGFGPSLIGFFFGVGFLEELIKSLPVLFLLYQYEDVPWRTACLWGMASGAGFGISEGIHYSTNYYNGFEPAGIYLLRFSSCVAFHVLLAGACAILLQRRQHMLNLGNGFFDWCITFMAIVSVPILLHGLFDTLLKKDFEWGAVVIAIGAFAWLAWLIKQSRRRELKPVKVVAPMGMLERTEHGMRYVKR